MPFCNRLTKHQPHNSQIFLNCCDFNLNSFSSPLLIAGSPRLFGAMIAMLSSLVSLCIRETFALRSLPVCLDYVSKRLSLHFQVACSNFVHKHFSFSLAQDSLNSCNGRSVASSSVALSLHAFFVHACSLFLLAFSTHVCSFILRLIIM